MSEEICRFWAVVPAAGVGRRMATNRPKQYLQLGKKTVLEHTLQRLFDAGVFDGVVVALSAEDGYWPDLSFHQSDKLHTVVGGNERADSVLAGVTFALNLARPDDWVLVHDAARPCLTTEDIHLLIDALKDDPVGGILALPVHDTLKRIDKQRISETVDRSQIWRALTPQMFRLGVLNDALVAAMGAKAPVTDEASAIEMYGEQPKIVEGRSDNIKITRPEDLSLANYYLEQQCCE